MNALDLLLKILTSANLATPQIANIIDIVKSGKATGKSDEEIEAESMLFALDTRQQTETDEGSQP